MNFLCMILTV